VAAIALPGTKPTKAVEIRNASKRLLNGCSGLWEDLGETELYTTDAGKVKSKQRS
jgi:hypothetical protein